MSRAANCHVADTSDAGAGIQLSDPPNSAADTPRTSFESNDENLEDRFDPETAKARRRMSPADQLGDRLSKPPPHGIYKRRDFKWVMLGSSLLALHASYINSATLMGVGGAQASTGAITAAVGKAAASFISAHPGDGLFYGSIVLSFLLGGILCAFFVDSTRFKASPQYGWALIAVGALLGASAVVIIFAHNLKPDQERWVYPLIALSAGLQNALCSNFYGTILRSTHLTGISTDIGMILGYTLRSKITHRRFEDTWRLLVLVPIWISYVAGAFLGAWSYALLHHYTLVPPVFTLFALGILWLTAIPATRYHKSRRRQRKIQHRDSECALESEVQSPHSLRL